MDSALNVRLGAKTKEFNTKMMAADKRLKRLGKTVSGIGRSMTMMFTGPLLMAGAASVKLSMDFQKSMTKIQTLVGRTDEQIAKMKDGIMQMSLETAKAPVELAEGLYFLESAGLSGENAMNTLNQVAKASASGLGDMESLATLAAAAQNAYGIETLTAADALDKFGVMVQTGMFDAEELTQVLGKQLGLSSSLGISFDEVGALISTYTATTGDATAATNGLSAIMMTFAKLESEPTKKQAEALDKIKMSAEDVKEMMGEKGLMQTMQHLQGEFDAAGVPMADFFTKSQALKTSLSLLGEQSEKYTENLEAQANATEFVNDAFEETSTTGAFQMEQAMNGLKVAGTQLGDSLAPVVAAITEKVQSLVDWWTSLDAETQANYASWATWIATVGPILLIFGGAITKLGSFIGLMKKWNVIGKISTGIQWLWNAAMTANPIGLIIAAIALVIAAMVYFATSTSNVAIKVRNFFRYMVNGVIAGINYIIDSVNSWGDYIGVTIPRIQELTMETEKSTEVVEDNADAVGDLNKELKAIPPVKTTVVKTDFKTSSGGGDTDSGGDDKAAERAQKKKEKAEAKSLEKIRKLKQKFNVLNEEDKHKSDLIALENSRTNALLAVEDTIHSEEEKLAINANFDKKRAKLIEKNTEKVNAEIDKQKTEWETMFDSIEEGWKKTMDVVNQFMGAWNGLMDAKEERENTMLTNRQIQEQADHDNRYQLEVNRIEATIENEDQKEKALAALDEKYGQMQADLQKKQDAEAKALQQKAARREKKMKIFDAIVNTAAAVVKALGSAPPPANFILAGIVGGLGIAEIATISSTPIPMAEGGIAFGPTNALVGEYKGAKNNPEVVAPLDKLKSLLGGDGSGTDRIALRGVLKGDDIFLSNAKTNIGRTRFV